MPGLVDDRGHREDDVGRAGHVGLAQLERDHERRGVERGAERRRVRGVVGVDAADDEPAELTGVDRGDDLVGVAARRLGQRLEAPGGGHVDPGLGVGDRAAAGQQVREAAGLDRAAVARTPRDPGQPGAGARREPGRGRQRARRGRQPLADHDHRGRVERVVAGQAERVEGRGLVAGCGRDQGAAVQLGSDDVLRACELRGLSKGHTTEDGLFTLTEVECLGACANAPMVQINDDNYEDLTEQSMGAILDALARGDTPKPGPQVDRKTSCPEGGPTSLKKMAERNYDYRGQWNSAPAGEGAQ